MNNKGQSLVLFIVLLPIIIIGFGFLIDYLNYTSEEIKYKNFTKQIIKETIELKYTEEDIKRLYKLNNYDYDTVQLIIDNNVSIKGEYIYDNIFNLVYNKYKVKVNYIGYKTNEKIIIEEGE